MKNVYWELPGYRRIWRNIAREFRAIGRTVVLSEDEIGRGLKRIVAIERSSEEYRAQVPIYVVRGYPPRLIIDGHKKMIFLASNVLFELGNVTGDFRDFIHLLGFKNIGAIHLWDSLSFSVYVSGVR